jgi:hypothetical protein
MNPEEKRAECKKGPNLSEYLTQFSFQALMKIKPSRKLYLYKMLITKYLF